jgi:hypothetical protein
MLDACDATGIVDPGGVPAAPLDHTANVATTEVAKQKQRRDEDRMRL